MLVSDQLWKKVIEHRSDLTLWTTWLNKYGENGSLVDIDDNTSFINLDKNRAIKIMFEPDSDSAFDFWFDNFGDTETGIIETLNVVFSSIDLALEPFIKTLDDWLNNQ